MFDTLRRLINQLLQQIGNKPTVMDTHQLKTNQWTYQWVCCISVNLNTLWAAWLEQPEPDQVRAKILSRHAPDAALTELSTNDFFQKIIRKHETMAMKPWWPLEPGYKTLVWFYFRQYFFLFRLALRKDWNRNLYCHDNKDGHSLALHTTSIETW